MSAPLLDRGVWHDLGCQCEGCISLVRYASEPREITPEMQEMAKDAERYRAIKDKESPFLVRGVHQHAQGQYYLSPNLDYAIDKWRADK